MSFDESVTQWMILFARCAIAMIFLVSGIHKAVWYGKAVAEFRGERVPASWFFLPATIALHLGASFALILGLYTREAALLLALFTIIATIKVHCFWRMQGDDRLIRSRTALVNLGVVGGLVLLAVVGPGRLVL